MNTTRLPPWQPASNGAGKHHWFLYRTDSTPFADRWHFGSNGRLIWYASHATALHAAARLNAAERKQDADDNRAYVRALLAERQPAFAAVLEAVTTDLAGAVS